ncbi:MAG: translation initiation factor IF-3 [Candidatus Liberibacter ctenarytainae]|uniref:Translation initiation factor IF-3 n=1 Tax=Candidatus Liberibacter ctenarytainae TaxID=2020335 RepID=A0A937AI66_9HYPH|nr:translation initiation factor IF-3 [Candidatus Liberibacter ctenarytainae]
MRNKVFKSPRSGAGAKDGRRTNEDLLVYEVVRLIASDGQNVSEVSTSEALQMARDQNLDLVTIDPSSDPPICKMLDLRKMKYISRKNASEARKKQKRIVVKEVKLTPVISLHDYEVKVKSIEEFLGLGYKVKISLKFRGRQILHPEGGYDLFIKVKEYMNKNKVVFKVDSEPKLEGRQMVMVLSAK